MTWVVWPGPGSDPAEVGHKLARLGRAAAVVAVPPSVCLPVAVHRMAVGEHRLARLREIADELVATRAFNLPGLAAEAGRVLADVTLPDGARDALTDALEALPGPVAVRSSALQEDSGSASYAGVYESYTDRMGPDAVAEAVLACWRSYYGPRALAARLRHGDDLAEPGMAVVVQRMVPAEAAGVAVTAPKEQVVVELVEGPGEALVSGLVAGTRVLGGDVAAGGLPPRLHGAADEVVAVASRLAGLLGEAVDVEWVWDGIAVHVVQVRPLAGRGTAPRADGPVVRVAPLYGPALPAGMSLGDCAEVYHHFRTKRGPAREAAVAAGFAVGEGWVVCFTHAGLRTDPGALPGATPGGRVVVDLGRSVRQVVLVADDLAGHLLRTTPRDDRLHTALVRRFVDDGVGVVSTTTAYDPGALLLDWSPDGLLALNRGTGGARTAVVRRDDPAASEMLCAAGFPTAMAERLPAVHDLTLAMAAGRPGAQLEWVVDDGRLVFVDLSTSRAPDLPGPGGAVAGSAVLAAGVLSPGAAAGPALTVDDRLLVQLSTGAAVSASRSEALEHRVLTDLLRRTQEAGRPPVVVADRPYAALSVLVDHVAGFVFRDGGLLSHLGMILRERGTPAMLAPDVAVADGQWLEIADGIWRVGEPA